MNCCKPESKSKVENFKCPTCNQNGSSVNLTTIECQVKANFQFKIENNTEYKFCENPDCSVVYFSKDPLHFFKSDEINEKVSLKDESLDVKLCYCFGITKKMALEKIKSDLESEVLNDIKAKMKVPGCFCEKSNPQGTCCLGNVSNWISETKKN